MYVRQYDNSFLALGAKASRFGDAEDIATGADNGVSAYGFRYTDHPDCLGVAIPVQSGASLCPYAARFTPFTGANHTDCTKVRLYSAVTKRALYAVFVDKGPSAYTGRLVDLLDAAVLKLGLKLEDGLYTLDVKIMPPGCDRIGLWGVLAASGAP